MRNPYNPMTAKEQAYAPRRVPRNAVAAGSRRRWLRECPMISESGRPLNDGWNYNKETCAWNQNLTLWLKTITTPKER